LFLFAQHKKVISMFDLFLQTDSTAAAQAGALATESLWSLLSKGGPIMIPLGILFAMMLYFFIERWMVIRKAVDAQDQFMSGIRENILNGNVSAARSLAKNNPNPIARIIDKGLQRIGKPIDAIEKSMDNVAKLELYKMEKNLGILSVVARFAPLF